MSDGMKTPEAAVAPRRVCRSCREVVEEIVRHSTEPLISLALSTIELVAVRAGGIVTLIGATGRGKTSLACSLLVEHARDRGPALAMSLELPADELTARVIGTQRGASWVGVLRGELTRESMIEVLPERLAVLDRESDLKHLERAVDELRASFPDGQLLIAVDYVQLVELEGERGEMRHKIGQVMRRLDQIARSRRAVVIALSQGSRSSSRVLNDGSKVGSETTDAGAESADLERWASVTLAIGKLGEQAEDGSSAVEISIGKSRMGGGDRVVPCRFWGRSGLWRIAGDSRAADGVRAERRGERARLRQGETETTLLERAQGSTEPLTRAQLGIGYGKPDAKVAIDNLLARGDLVFVRARKSRSSSWLIWTRGNALRAGLPVMEATATTATRLPPHPHPASVDTDYSRSPLKGRR
jgi:hypothetical protein